MKIQVLIENTTSEQTLQAEHGLSLYIETDRHCILFDTGQSTAFAENAEKMGVDLSKVDIAILSHGHNDHGGGLTRFLECNQHAPVYLNKHAFVPHFNAAEKYIGLEKELAESDRLIYVGDKLEIDEGMTLFSCNRRKRTFGFDSFGLKTMEKGTLVPDDFRHEQYLLVEEEGKRVLFSGCSHKGILNIVRWFQPDVLIGGLHLNKLEPTGERLIHVADVLNNCQTKFFTGHCTGQAQYEALKEKLGDKLQYIATGLEVII